MAAQQEALMEFKEVEALLGDRKLGDAIGKARNSVWRYQQEGEIPQRIQFACKYIKYLVENVDSLSAQAKISKDEFLDRIVSPDHFNMSNEEFRAWKKRHNLTFERIATLLGLEVTTPKKYSQDDYPIPRDVSLATKYLSLNPALL